MKKILFVLLAMFFANNLSAASLTPSQEGKRWTVIVTVQTSVKYYSEAHPVPSNFLGGQNREIIEQPFSVYAETADEAERIAKDKCRNVCSDQRGEYQGPANFGGQPAHMYLYRTILKARAK